MGNSIVLNTLNDINILEQPNWRTMCDNGIPFDQVFRDPLGKKMVCPTDNFILEFIGLNKNYFFLFNWNVVSCLSVKTINYMFSFPDKKERAWSTIKSSTICTKLTPDCVACINKYYPNEIFMLLNDAWFEKNKDIAYNNNDILNFVVNNKRHIFLNHFDIIITKLNCYSLSDDFMNEVFKKFNFNENQIISILKLNYYKIPHIYKEIIIKIIDENPNVIKSYLELIRYNSYIPDNMLIEIINQHPECEKYMSINLIKNYLYRHIDDRSNCVIEDDICNINVYYYVNALIGQHLEKMNKSMEQNKIIMEGYCQFMKTNIYDQFISKAYNDKHMLFEEHLCLLISEYNKLQRKIIIINKNLVNKYSLNNDELLNRYLIIGKENNEWLQIINKYHIDDREILNRYLIVEKENNEYLEISNEYYLYDREILNRYLITEKENNEYLEISNEYINSINNGNLCKMNIMKCLINGLQNTLVSREKNNKHQIFTYIYMLIMIFTIIKNYFI